MKTSLLVLFTLFLFTACSEKNTLTMDECLKQGLVLKNEKRLNFRTGEYEIKSVCKERG